MPIVTDPKTGRRVMVRTPGTLDSALASRIFTPEHFDFVSSPQQHDEPNAAYGVRRFLGSPLRGISNLGAAVFNDAAQGINYGLSTPDTSAPPSAGQAFTAQQAQPQAPSASNVFPNSFRDPAYDQADQIASHQFGVPTEILRNIRLRGEKSNNNQVSSAGATTPYQIIPSTAEGIQRNYGINVHNSPLDAAKGAAAVLAEGYRRTGSWDGAVTQYIGGTDPSHYGPVTAAYRQRVLGADTPLEAPLVNPFDPTYGNAAISDLNAGQAEALKPQTFTVDRPAAPEMPAPTPFATTDFSKADQALQDMRPVEITEREKLRVQRMGMFQGLGQALANLPDGASLGKVLAAAGGGALAGRARGDQEVLARQDKFDDEMARWRASIYTNNMQEAEVHAREANTNVQQMNQYALAKWQTAYGQWSKDNHVDVTGDAVVSTQQGADGKIEVTRTPIRAAVMAGFAIHRASIHGSMMGAQEQGNGLVASANNSIASIAATQAALKNGSDSPDAAANLIAGVAMPAATVVQNGRTMDVFGDAQSYDGARREINGRMTQDGWAEPLPGDSAGAVKYREEFDHRMAELLVRGALRDPTGQFRRRLFGAAIPGMMLDRAQQQTKQSQRTTTDWRGRQSTSTTVSGDSSQ